MEDICIMAKSTLNISRTVTDKVSVKGVLSKNGTTITYKNELKEDKDIEVSDCLAMFKGQVIDLSVTVKNEEDMNPSSSEN